MNIDEGNKIIGEFMGYVMYDKRYPRNHGVGAPEAVRHDMIIQKAKYNSSWDALIEVINKVNEYAEVYIRSGGQCNIHFIGEVINIKAESMIEATWLAVIEFIRYFNREKSHLIGNLKSAK